MAYWTMWRIWLVRWSGIPILMLVTFLLMWVFGVDSWYAGWIGFIAFVIYVVLIVMRIDKKRKKLMKEYLETGDKENLEKAFPSHKSSKKK
jgi:H+/gluconate symporter-like permease